jgi:hypothetical protein
MESILEQRVPPQWILGTSEGISMRMCCLRRDDGNIMMLENMVGLLALRID